MVIPVPPIEVSGDAVLRGEIEERSLWRAGALLGTIVTGPSALVISGLIIAWNDFILENANPISAGLIAS